MEQIPTCPICFQPISDSSFNPGLDLATIHCARCGNYRIIGELTRTMSKVNQPDNYHLLCGAIRELNEQGIEPTIESFESLLSLVRVPKNPIEMMDRVLMSLKATQARVGVAKSFSPDDFPIAYAHDMQEFHHLMRQLREIGYIRNHNGANDVGELEPAGWRRLVELEERTMKGDQAFVAMPFRPVFDDLWNKGLRPALEETGYRPIRVDKTEHDEKIDDYIISQIRKSRLMVADFTGQNQGVYFEAGFAMGLGVHVIRTCKDDPDEFRKLHFDTRQYNHIKWTNPSDLRTKLTNRINAFAPLKGQGA